MSAFPSQPSRPRTARAALTFAPIASLSALAPSLVLLLGFASACAAGSPALTPQAPLPAEPAVTSTSATPATASDEATLARVRAALSGPARTDKERARDAARHPAETLAFFGVKDDAKVIELWPGGGYYTAILAPVLHDRGALAVTHFDVDGDPKSEDTQESRAIFDRLAKSPATFDKVTKQRIAAPDVSLGPDGSADFVLTFRNVHNWIESGYAEKVFAATARVLRPGGVLGVEEHRGRPGMTTKEIRDSGYVPEDLVVKLAEQAGLRLDARSELNANPKDTRDYPNGVWSLPPSLAGKDVDRAKYTAIGESDRMTLRFVKP